MEINEYLGKLIRMAKTMEGIDFFSEKAKLTRTEFRLLREVMAERAKGKEIISSELARRLGVTRSAVSQLVAKMEKNGIVERAPSPVDRKIAFVRLSEKSIALYEEQCAAANRLMELVVKDLGREKLDALCAANDEFLAALARARRSATQENKNKEPPWGGGDNVKTYRDHEGL